MKTIIYATTLLIALSLSQSAFANGIFQCRDANGVMTFTFTPCADEAPAAEQDNPGADQQQATAAVTKREVSTTASLSSNDQQQPAGRKDRLEALDASIARLEAELQDARQAYRRSLSAENRESDNRSYNQLTAEFDLRTSELVDEIARLQLEREAVLRF